MGKMKDISALKADGFPPLPIKRIGTSLSLSFDMGRGGFKSYQKGRSPDFISPI